MDQKCWIMVCRFLQPPLEQGHRILLLRSEQKVLNQRLFNIELKVGGTVLTKQQMSTT